MFGEKPVCRSVTPISSAIERKRCLNTSNSMGWTRGVMRVANDSPCSRQQHVAEPVDGETERRRHDDRGLSAGNDRRHRARDRRGGDRPSGRTPFAAGARRSGSCAPPPARAPAFDDVAWPATPALRSRPLRARATRRPRSAAIDPRSRTDVRAPRETPRDIRPTTARSARTTARCTARRCCRSTIGAGPAKPFRHQFATRAGDERRRSWSERAHGQPVRGCRTDAE